MSQIEHANDRGRRGADFPKEWGTPPGTMFSQERAAWVAANVRRMEADPNVRLRRLAVAEDRRQMAELEGLIALVDSHRLVETAAALRKLRDSFTT